MSPCIGFPSLPLLFDSFFSLPSLLFSSICRIVGIGVWSPSSITLLNCSYYSQCVAMEILDLLMVKQMAKVELRFVSVTHMGASVLTFGMKWKHKLSVDSWDS